MTHKLNESAVEDQTLAWFSELGYETLYGPDISPDSDGTPGTERGKYEQVILSHRFLQAVSRINPGVDRTTLDAVLRKLTRTEFPLLIANNHAFHRMLVEGVSVECRRKDGSPGYVRIKFVDFDEPDNNDWLVVNQFTVIEGNHNRRPDAVVFVNGIPLAVIELKNPLDEKATIWSAFNQLQTYKKQISSLFVYNEILIISDGLEARFGSLSADRERFMPWRTIEGEELAPNTMIQLEVLLKGIFEKRRFLDYLRYFIVYEEDGSKVVKKIAGYHQYHAVRTAVSSTVRAVSPDGDKRCGVVWHTQGSGKSLTMAFYAGKAIQHPMMENPTLVVITDRNDLDDQLFGTFSSCHELLRQKPVQVEDRADLRKKLMVGSGGVVFTTIQKFFPDKKGDDYPVLSERKNIVVIADEAHRSQYDFIDGFARHMRDALPNASFIGFTGTPLETTDRNTKAVFGEYISVYDIQRAVDDGATVPIFYEARLAKLELSEDKLLSVDPDFEEITEGQEDMAKHRLKRKWAAIEKIVGAESRLDIVAKDLVEHFTRRQEVLSGKAMIVCMSRRICVEMYNSIVSIRPEWHSEDDGKGNIKIVMTGSASDELDWQIHIRSKKRREDLANRFKDPEDPFQIVIVRDMWLTGFDAPSLHTMYLDKPMHSHTLMQAIARVNRVFKDKPGGLIVDYLGIADDLRKAMANYTLSGGMGKTALDQEEAVAIMLEWYDVCCSLFHGFDWSGWEKARPMEKLAFLPPAQEHILAQEDGKERLLEAVMKVSKAFALSVPHKETTRIRDDVGFFQAVRTAISKSTESGPMSDYEMDAAIKQIVSRVISTDGVIDIFSSVGLKRPDISILSEEFLAQVRKIPQRNLAVEALRKLLNDEISVRSVRNLVQYKSFSKMLTETVKRYKKKAITSAEAIETLLGLAREMREAYRRGEELGLSEGELAFYDALEVNDSAVKILGDEVLKNIAIELVETVRKNTSIDWTVKESVRAKLRVMIKRVLRKHGYPPDKQEKATRMVLKQAEMIAEELTE